MRCRECGHDNDSDATFCEKCGANLRAPEGMSALSKGLIVAVIILVVILGVAAGAMMNNQTTPAENASANETTDDSGQTTTETTSAYKTFSNGVISFEYPSSWGVQPNGPNTMVIVGGSDFPYFSVYDESKYGQTSLADYVSSSKKGMEKDGFTVRSERSTTVDGYPAYELIYQGEKKVLHMVLVETSPGQKYYALEGVDYTSHYEQEITTFNQIINSFQFL